MHNLIFRIILKPRELHVGNSYLAPGYPPLSPIKQEQGNHFTRENPQFEENMIPGEMSLIVRKFKLFGRLERNLLG